MRPPNLSASAPKYRCGSSFEALPMSGKFPRMGHGQGPGGRFLRRCMARWNCNTTSVDNNAASARSSMTRDLPTLSKSSKLELTTVSFTTCGRLEDPRAVCCSISTCRNPAHFLNPTWAFAAREIYFLGSHECPIQSSWFIYIWRAVDGWAACWSIAATRKTTSFMRNQFYYYNKHRLYGTLWIGS